MESNENYASLLKAHIILADEMGVLVQELSTARIRNDKKQELVDTLSKENRELSILLLKLQRIVEALVPVVGPLPDAVQKNIERLFERVDAL